MCCGRLLGSMWDVALGRFGGKAADLQHYPIRKEELRFILIKYILIHFDFDWQGRITGEGGRTGKDYFVRS